MKQFNEKNPPSRRTAMKRINDGRCVYCGSQNLDGSSWDNYLGNYVSQEVSCADCSRTWIEEYKLIGWKKQL